MIALLIFCISFAVAFRCNDADYAIYRAKGSTFSTLFRSYGGLFTYQSTFEESVVQGTGLSSTCATCYGDSYICGYNNCKYKCALAGNSCTRCLDAAQCIRACDECTGFNAR